MNPIKRRDFLKKSTAALAGGSVLLTGCQSGTEDAGPAVHTRKKYRWKMVTTWTPRFPVMGEGAELFAQWVEEMSGGQMKIHVYGAGELVPAFEAFEAVRSGVAEMSHGVSYYWAGKIPAAQFFAAVPFGMNAQQMNAWILSGGGLQLWEELYAPFGLLPMPAGNTGFQMGGWFNREINSVRDLQGLKMRIPGLGGKVIDKAGGAGIVKSGAEIYTNLERGVIDATEWIGPYHDYLKGFHKIARYYYYPGWHEPGTVLELTVSKPAFEKLPAELQGIIRAAAFRANTWMLSEFEAKNNEYLQKLVNEHHVQLRRFPDDVLAAFKRYSGEVIQELIASDEQARKIYTSFKEFKDNVSGWSRISEAVYYSTMA
ncbi:MAG TPA: TRAP transporter substrate-binding protein [Bacteroidetes bacterium]|nr:TRAP transporter substrate-binding protein [Bacteroidota bacterium]